MRGVFGLADRRQALLRLGGVVAVLVVYESMFMVAYSAIGSAAFLMALVPCFVAGVSLGAWAAFVAVLLTIAFDRGHGLALGLPVGPQLVAAVLAKLLVGVGAGVVRDHQLRLRQLNAALLRETTERVEAQTRLEDSARLQRELLENLGEGVGLFDASGQLAFANPMLRQMLQMDAAVLGGPFSAWTRVPSSGSYPHNYEVVLPERGERGERHLAITETRLLSSIPASESTLCVVRDLTERVAAEQRQRKLELDLERNQALQGLAVLAGGVAHDFNNLLGGVVGNAELALRKLPTTTPAKVRECLSEIKVYAKEAAALSRQMLAYAGRRSLAIAVLDVNQEIEEALRLVRTTIAARANLRVVLAKELPAVSADATQLRQVVTNLLLNAAEALGETRGSVTITTGVRHVSESELSSLKAPAELKSGDYIEVAVEDTGIGIAEEHRERIFQPYFSTKSQGRGMGLAAAWGIARTHRGWLSVESRPGSGSRFAFWLPLGLPATDGVPAASRRVSDVVPRPECVLLIDDEPAVRLVTQKLLAELGRRVVTAECGQRGIDLFVERRRDIDLVLLDLTMPDLSGAEVLARLRRIEPSVNVVITSGFQPSDAQYLTSEPNVVGFLEKPHTLANLEAVLGLRSSASHTSSLAQ